jgi:hypothetical protein
MDGSYAFLKEKQSYVLLQEHVILQRSLWTNVRPVDLYMCVLRVLVIIRCRRAMRSLPHHHACGVR